MAKTKALKTQGKDLIYLQKCLRSCNMLPVAILIATLQVAATVSAQPLWPEQISNNFIAFEVLKPKFEERDAFSFFSAAFYLPGGLRLNRKLVLVGILPTAHASIRVLRDSSHPQLGFFEASKMVVGNPYVGLQFRRPGSTRFIEIGAWIPLVPDLDFPVSSVAESADYDRREAFIAAPSINGKLHYHYKTESNVVLQLRGGSTIFFRGDDEFAEISLDYAVEAGYEGLISIIGGLSGRFLVTNDLGFGERTIHTLGGTVSFGLGKVRPAIHFHIAIGQNSEWVSSGDTIDYVFGLNLMTQAH